MADRDLNINVDVAGNAVVNITNINNSLRGTETQAHKSAGAMKMFKGALAAVGFTVGAKAAVDLTTALIDKGRAWQSARGTVIAYTGSLSSATKAIEDAQKATDGLVSKTNSAIAVNAFFRNGLAETGAEAGKLALTGQILSSAYTAQGATFEKYIRFLSTGNIALADNFNLTQAMINERATLIQTTEAMGDVEAKATARRQLMNEAAEGIIETMPELERAILKNKAATSDLSDALAENLLPVLTDVVLWINKGIEGFEKQADATEAFHNELIKGTETYDEYLENLDAAREELGAGTLAFGYYTEAQVDAARAIVDTTEALEDQTVALATADVAASKLATSEEAINRRRASHMRTMDALAQQETDRNEEALDATLRAADEAADALEQRENDYTRYVSRMEAIDRRAASQAISHANTVASLRQQIERAANAGIEAQRLRLSRSLEDMADRHADAIQAIRDQMADLESGYRDDSVDDEQEYRDDVEDLAEAHGNRLARLEQDLANARDNNERRAIRARIAEENELYAEQLARMERDRQQEIDRNQREHDQKVDDLKDRIEEENSEYEEQRARARQRADEDMAILQAQNAQRVADLQARLALEEESFARMQAEIERQREEERASIAETLSAMAHFSGTSVTLLNDVTDAWRRQTDAIRAARDASYSYQTPYNIPGYQSGTSYVPQTGLALLHKGEAIVPAGEGRPAGSGNTYNFIYQQHGVSLSSEYELDEWFKSGLRKAGVSA